VPTDTEVRGSMKEIVLEIENLEKTYAGQAQPALTGITFAVKRNERVGIIGANGSGKTTLFRLILNLIRPDKGRIKLMGQTDLEQAKIHVGFVSEHQEGLENFTPDELLDYAGQMAGMQKSEIHKRKVELLDWVELTDKKNDLVSGFSKGMIQRLQLALALIHQPEILLFDEPMSGLDPSGQKSLRSLIKKLNDHTFLYASHNLDEIEDLCDRVIILKQGKMINDLKIGTYQREIFIIRVDKSINSLLKKFPAIEICQVWNFSDGHEYELCAEVPLFQEFLVACKEKNIHIKRIRSRNLLEDLYEKFVKNAH